MKLKYENMVDAWIKKHYGDLERGVIADEVKYKILFRIYRKKYKKAKHKSEAVDKHDKKSYIGTEYITQDSIGNECRVKITEPHKEEDDKSVRSCYRCGHSVFKTLTNYMGVSTGVLWCEKNKNRCYLLNYICDEFEEKKNEFC